MKSIQIIQLIILAPAGLLVVLQNRAATQPTGVAGAKSSVEVFYIANEGFLIASGDKKVLVDE